MEAKLITVEIQMETGGNSFIKSYQVPYSEGLSVLGVLQYIQENFDPTLAFYSSCRMGKCTGCFVNINGKTRLACTTIVTGNLKILPSNGKVIRDLVVIKENTL